MSKFKSCLLNVVLAFGSLFVVLFIAEIILRVSGATDAYIERPENPQMYTYDKEVGYRMRSNLKGEPFHGFDWGVNLIKTNRQGWRAPEIPAEKGPNEKRIFLVGDSVVAGLEVKENQTMSALMEKELGPDYRVINTGTRGWSSAQMSVLIEKKILPLKPDLILMVTVYNDPIDNLILSLPDKPARRPAFRLGKDGELIPPTFPVTNYPQTDYVHLVSGSKIVKESKSEKWLKRRALQRKVQAFKRQFALHRFVSLKWGAIKDQQAAKKGQATARPVYEVQRIDVQAPKDLEQELMMSLYCKIIGHTESLLEENGVKFLVSAYVGPYQFNPKEMGLKTMDPTWREKFTQSTCLKNPEAFVSVFDEFKEQVVKKKKQLYWPHDEHYSKLGHATAAKVYAQKVRELLGEN